MEYDDSCENKHDLKIINANSHVWYILTHPEILYINWKLANDKMKQKNRWTCPKKRCCEISKTCSKNLFIIFVELFINQVEFFINSGGITHVICGCREPIQASISGPHDSFIRNDKVHFAVFSSFGGLKYLYSSQGGGGWAYSLILDDTVLFASYYTAKPASHYWVGM